MTRIELATDLKRMSFDRIKAFSICPWACLLQYEMGYEPNHTFFLKFEDLMADAVTGLAKGEFDTRSAIETFETGYDAKMEGAVPPPNKNYDYFKEYRKEGSSSLENLPRFWDGLRILSTGIPIAYEIDGVQVEDLVDIVLERTDRDGLVIVDLDCTKVDFYKENDAKGRSGLPYEKFLPDYDSRRRRMLLAAEAVGKIYGKADVDSWICYFMNAQKPSGVAVKRVLGTSIELNEAKAWLFDTMQRLKACQQSKLWPKTFEVNAPGSYCKQLCVMGNACRRVGREDVARLRELGVTDGGKVVPAQYLEMKIHLRTDIEPTTPIVQVEKGVANVLAKIGVQTVADLAGKTAADFFRIQGCGEGKVRKILAAFYK